MIFFFKGKKGSWDIFVNAEKSNKNYKIGKIRKLKSSKDKE